MCLADIWNWLSANAANVIAICALAATFWQAYIARRHNRLSIRPYLTVWANSDPYNAKYEFQISNKGVGPAFIRGFQVYVDSKEIGPEEGVLISKAVKVLFNGSSLRVKPAHLVDGCALNSGESLSLFDVEILSPLPVDVDLFDSVNDRLRILIKYESIYKEKWELDSSKLS